MTSTTTALRTEKKFDDTGRFDHIAFAATDVDGMRKRLQAKEVKFRESIVPRTGDTQFSTIPTASAWS